MSSLTKENVEEEVTGKNLPDIKVRPPGPMSKSLAERLIKYESKGVSSIATGKIPIVWAKAKGANIVDADGNVYIELSAALTVAIVGHSNNRVIDALKKQADKLIHAPGGTNPNIPRIELVEKLAQITPGDLTKSILMNTGAEAVELATKTARLYTGKREILAFHGGFHGKSYGALSFTSRNFYREAFRSFVSGSTHVPYPYCYRCPFGKSSLDCQFECIKYLEYVLDEPCSALGEIAAILLEPVQGHEGVIVPPDSFLSEIRRICDERNILMITDEIITGFGRTGKWFAVNHSNVVPDLMVIGKGIASGFPISGVIGKADIMDTWSTITGESTHSSTFMANPLGCAVSLASIAEIETKDLVNRAAKLGTAMLTGFKELGSKYSIIGEVRGKGMYVGVEIVRDRSSKQPAPELAGKIASKAMEMGVIIGTFSRFATSISASVQELQKSPMTADTRLTPISFSIALTDSAGLHLLSSIISLILVTPFTPPFAFISSAASLIPSIVSPPS